MKSVLISINPKWVEKIVNGEKTIEVRKTSPKCETPFKCYIYMTQGKLKDLGIYSEWVYKNRMKVIGEFVCDRVYKWECKNRLEILESFPTWRASYMLFVDDLEKTCLTYNDLWDYGKGKPLYGWHISELRLYDKPRELSEFNAVCRYINEDKSCHFRKVVCPYQQFDCNEDGSINIVECSRVITRPPQSWCYVEELQEKQK